MLFVALKPWSIFDLIYRCFIAWHAFCLLKSCQGNDEINIFKKLKQLIEHPCLHDTAQNEEYNFFQFFQPFNTILNSVLLLSLFKSLLFYSMTHEYFVTIEQFHCLYCI